MLKKVVKDVSGIVASDEADIMTRMEVFSGVITEMEKMFTMLSVSTTFISFNHSFFPGLFNLLTLQNFIICTTHITILNLQNTIYILAKQKKSNEIFMYH